MASGRSLGSFLSLAGTLFHLGVVLGMEPPARPDRGSIFKNPAWLGHAYGVREPYIWAPHMENLGEGRPAFLGGRCPGRQASGAPFRIEEYPLPLDYDPFAFPGTDVVACVRLDTDGVVRKARLVGGTGSAAMDRRLLRALFREWRFAPVDSGGAAQGWQRIRLNAVHRPARPPGPVSARPAL